MYEQVREKQEKAYVRMRTNLGELNFEVRRRFFSPCCSSLTDTRARFYLLQLFSDRAPKACYNFLRVRRSLCFFGLLLPRRRTGADLGLPSRTYSSQLRASIRTSSFIASFPASWSVLFLDFTSSLVLNVSLSPIASRRRSYWNG